MCYLSPSPVVVAGRISADIKFSCSFICHLGTFKQVYYMLHGGIHAWLKWVIQPYMFEQDMEEEELFLEGDVQVDSVLFL